MSVYHLISRLAHRAFFLDDEEKQHFTMSFNGHRDHHGTMFEGRNHERNHRPEPEVMWRTSAYIDINAWEAGIAHRSEDYEWCSFAAALKGDEKARQGYAFMYKLGGDRPLGTPWSA